MSDLERAAFDKLARAVGGHIDYYDNVSLMLIAATRVNRLTSQVAAAKENEAFHPLAMKLIKKRKNFVVVAEDEPYYFAVYTIIRHYEQQRGRWTAEDEQIYQAAFSARKEAQDDKSTV